MQIHFQKFLLHTPYHHSVASLPPYFLFLVFVCVYVYLHVPHLPHSLLSYFPHFNPPVLFSLSLYFCLPHTLSPLRFRLSLVIYICKLGFL